MRCEYDVRVAYNCVGCKAIAITMAMVYAHTIPLFAKP